MPRYLEGGVIPFPNSSCRIPVEFMVERKREAQLRAFYFILLKKKKSFERIYDTVQKEQSNDGVRHIKRSRLSFHLYPVIYTHSIISRVTII